MEVCEEPTGKCSQHLTRVSVTRLIEKEINIFIAKKTSILFAFKNGQIIFVT